MVYASEKQVSIAKDFDEDKEILSFPHPFSYFKNLPLLPCLGRPIIALM